MKLHRLEIQAFGPFANKEVIEFSQLGENPLFLIDGPTGAGKSSILHAICYALYGETTDTDRKELGLRCDHAKAELLTELSLTFSIRGDKYRITRVPTQQRPAKRGDGFTEQKATAHLTVIQANGEEKTLVAKKKKDADIKIAEIIGLTAEQFLQVMVLPQGKFRELLLAKSDQRQVILSTLFQTEIYNIIEQLLKDKAKNIEKQHQGFEARKTEVLLEAAVADVDELGEAIEQANESQAQKGAEKDSMAQSKQTAASRLEVAENLKKTFASRDDKQKQLAACLQKTDDINAGRRTLQRAEKASFIAPKWQNLHSALNDKDKKQADLVNAQNNQKRIDQHVASTKEVLEKAAQAYQQRDDFKRQQTLLEGYQAKWADYDLLKKTLLAVENSYLNTVETRAGLEQQEQTLAQRLNDLTLSIDQLTDSIEADSELAVQVLLAKGHYEKRKQLETVQGECQELEQSYQQRKFKLDELDGLYRQVQEKADQTEMLWFSNQAAVLAAKLKENQPCTVCGSLEHPHPAVFSNADEAIDQQRVKSLRQQEKDSFDKMNAAKESMNGVLLTLENKQLEKNKLVDELADNAEKTVAMLKKILLDFEWALKQREGHIKQLSVLKSQKLSTENECTALSNQLKDVQQQLQQATIEQARAKSKLESADKELPEAYRSAESIEQALSNNQKLLLKLEQDYESANKAHSAAQNEQSANQARQQELEKNLQALINRVDELTTTWRQTLHDSEFASQAEFESAQLEPQAQQKLLNTVQAHDEAVKQLTAELGVLDQQLQDKQPPEMDKLMQQFSELSSAYREAETLWTQAQQLYKSLLDRQHKISAIEKQQASIKQQYEVVGALAKAASGRGNVRVSLERFVLGNLLDSVLSIASQRLYIMSKGQYRLIRQNEEQQLRNTTAGLDLAIDDAYTGKTRPVATLSGGESFMASLALALGLSDVVQERSGGIQLDTLFIDEGFGSLDQESLQLAINTLIDLQSGGRTIGIISHVSELKEQMAQRIEVIGSRAGSTIKTVV